MIARRFFSLSFSLIIIFTMLLVSGPAVMAQEDTEFTPDIAVTSLGIMEESVIIDRATVAGPAWVVIHADADGKPGSVIGYAALEEGENTDVVVPIDTEAATPILHAMLHEDAGEVGTYEFPGPDGPITIEDNIVMAQFSAAPPVPEEEAEDAAAEGAAAEEGTAAAETTAATTAEEGAAAEAEEEMTEEAAPAETTAEETMAEEAATEEAAAGEAMAEEETTGEAMTDEAKGSEEMAGTKGAAPSSMPTTGASASMPSILLVIAVVLLGFGGSAYFTRRHS